VQSSPLTLLNPLQKGIKSIKKNLIAEVFTESKNAIYHAYKKGWKKSELRAILADSVDKDIAIVNQYWDGLG
jgi:hypothetical protein